MEPVQGSPHWVRPRKDPACCTAELQDRLKDAKIWIWGKCWPKHKYGIIKSVRVIRDQEGNSRGYGFVEFDAREDFVAAYKNATHRKIDGSRIIVDYERGIGLVI